MRSCSGFRVQLISESTVDAGLWLAVVEVDVHPGVAEGAATTIARHLEITKLGMILCVGRGGLMALCTAHPTVVFFR